jgi:hypothetical protein
MRVRGPWLAAQGPSLLGRATGATRPCNPDPWVAHTRLDGHAIRGGSFRTRNRAGMHPARNDGSRGSGTETWRTPMRSGVGTSDCQKCHAEAMAGAVLRCTIATRRSGQVLEVRYGPPDALGEARRQADDLHGVRRRRTTERHRIPTRGDPELPREVVQGMRSDSSGGGVGAHRRGERVGARGHLEPEVDLRGTRQSRASGARRSRERDEPTACSGESPLAQRRRDPLRRRGRLSLATSA